MLLVSGDLVDRGLLRATLAKMGLRELWSADLPLSLCAKFHDIVNILSPTKCVMTS